MQPCDVVGQEQAVCQVVQSKATAVAVAAEGAEAETKGPSVMFEEPAKLLSISPSFGPASGGSIIDVRGSGFVEGCMLKCRFGHSSALEARIVTSTLVRCTSPVAAPGIVDLVIPSTWSAAPLQFQFKPSIRVVSIKPSRIFEHFASVLTIAGRKFVPDVDMRCSFGSGDIAEGSWIDTSRIKCLSPKLSMGNYSVHLMSSVNIIGSAPVPMKVARQAQLTDLQLASAIAGAIVTIFGGNFLALSAQIECVFDNISVLTRSIEESKVTCVVPDLRGKEVDVSQ